MQTSVGSIRRPLLRAFYLLGIILGSAHGQIYIAQQGIGVNNGTVAKYDATTGAANANFITGLNGPGGLLLSGNSLFVVDHRSYLALPGNWCLRK